MSDSPAGAHRSESSQGPERTLLGHPPGLFVLFFAEMWERFSYYGMRALLTLYMVKVLGYQDDVSAGVYGAYGSLVYMFPVIGGYLAEKLLGYRNAIILGGVFMAIGHGLMSIQNEYGFYFALAFLCVGNGFFKPNISSTVGKLYGEGDGRRDAGFTIFYMGINLGALLAPWVCGPLGENVGWHYGFGAAAIGMVFGLIVFIAGTSTLRGKADARDPDKLKKSLIPGLDYHKAVWLAGFLITPLIALLLWQNAVVTYLVTATFAVVLVVLITVALRQHRVGRDRMVSLMILMVFHMMFWAFFEQAGSSLTLYADRVVNRTLPLLGEQPASWFQGVNPFFILLFAPLFSVLWTHLARRKKQPSIPVKFSLGLIQLGLGYGLLVLGMIVIEPGQRTAWTFLILMYLLHTTGELCLSPVGLSAVTKLAPEKLVGFVMGAWFLTISGGHLIAGAIAKLTKVEFARGTALDQLTRGTYKLDEGGGLATLVHGDQLKEPLNLTQLIDTLGEQGVAPQQVVDHAVSQGFLTADAAREVTQLIGAEGAQSTGVAVDSLERFVIGPILESYQPVYTYVFFVALGLGVVLLVISPWIKKLMHGIE